MSDQMGTPWPNGHPSAPQLDGYLLGEFDGAAERRLADHISTCPDCSRHVEAAAAFRAPGAEDRILASVANELGRRKQRRLSTYRLLVASAAVAIGVVVFLGPKLMDTSRKNTPAVPTDESPPGVRLKGAPVTLYLFGLVAGEPQRLEPSVRLEPGDRLQASATSSTLGHVALYDVMSETVALLAAAPGGEALPVRPGTEVPLEPAFELEAVEQGEQLVLLFCPRPFVPGRAPTSPAAFAGWNPVEGCIRTIRLLQPEAGESAP